MNRGRGRARAAGLLLGFAADRILGDPQRWHPVAGFGQLAARAEQAWYADSRARGAWHWTVLVGGTVAAGWLAERATTPSRHELPTESSRVTHRVVTSYPATRHELPSDSSRVTQRVVTNTALTALATWSVLGGRSLDREAAATAERLAAGDLEGARRQLARFVGRDTSQLDPGEISRAVVESLAENSSDAVVSPLTWGAIAGIPGLIGYRAVNTLDAMVGHRTARLERFGWASARADDLANLVGARMSGALAVAGARLVGGSSADAAHAVLIDSRAHPSPNAGVVEAAFAGSLGIQLGGENHYASGVEHRAVMGSGRAARPDDIDRARRLARVVQYSAVAVCAAAAVGFSRVR